MAQFRTLETEPRMPMRDVTKHKTETERARRGLLSTLHVDIETSCRMGGLHIGRSKRVSLDGALLLERQARKVQRLRNEAAAGGLAVRVEFGNLESRSISWVERPSRRLESASNIEKSRPEKASNWIQVDGEKVPGATGQGRLIRRPRISARGRQSRRT